MIGNRSLVGLMFVAAILGASVQAGAATGKVAHHKVYLSGEETVHSSERLLSVARRAQALSFPAREAAQNWLESIARMLGEGHSGWAVRAVIELDAALQRLGGYAGPVDGYMRAGLVTGPADIVPYEDLHQVEVIAPGVLIASSQPHGAGWDVLARHGVRTVVNLRREDNTESDAVRAHGMQPVFISIIDQTPPTLLQALRFVRLVDDPANQPVVVHCLGGIGRTHSMVAAYRIVHGESDAKIEAEARAFGLWSPSQIQFLREFSRWVANAGPHAAVAP